LFALTFSFFSLKLYKSAFVTGINAIFWFVLLLQAIIFPRAK
jgi:hypothetical protein